MSLLKIFQVYLIFQSLFKGGEKHNVSLLSLRHLALWANYTACYCPDTLASDGNTFVAPYCCLAR